MNNQRKARFDRPEREVERLRKQKKLLVRERIDLLLDPSTPFMELSTLAANLADEGIIPSADVVSGGAYILTLSDYSVMVRVRLLVWLEGGHNRQQRSAVFRQCSEMHSVYADLQS